MKPRKILIMGLPGAGKTTLGQALQRCLPKAMLFDGDGMRALTNNWDFSPAGRLKQATIMGETCDQAMVQGSDAIAAFVCPTVATRDAFWGRTPIERRFCVLVDRAVTGPFADTNKIFNTPSFPNYTVRPDATVEKSVANIMLLLAPPFDWTAPTAVFIGRYQPFHQGHRELIEHGIRKYGQAWIGVREMVRGPSNPHTYFEVEDAIYAALYPDHAGKFEVAPVPNVASIMYGRDVGYRVEEVRLSPEVEAISATKIRAGERL